MRTREAIEEEGSPERERGDVWGEEDLLRLIIEVNLDIRDLMVEISERLDQEYEPLGHEEDNNDWRTGEEPGAVFKVPRS